MACFKLSPKCHTRTILKVTNTLGGGERRGGTQPTFITCFSFIYYYVRNAWMLIGECLFKGFAYLKWYFWFWCVNELGRVLYWLEHWWQSWTALIQCFPLVLISAEHIREWRITCCRFAVCELIFANVHLKDGFLGGAVHFLQWPLCGRRVYACSSSVHAHQPRAGSSVGMLQPPEYEGNALSVLGVLNGRRGVFYYILRRQWD